MMENWGGWVALRGCVDIANTTLALSLAAGFLALLCLISICVRKYYLLSGSRLQVQFISLFCLSYQEMDYPSCENKLPIFIFIFN